MLVAEGDVNIASAHHVLQKVENGRQNRTKNILIFSFACLLLNGINCRKKVFSVLVVFSPNRRLVLSFAQNLRKMEMKVSCRSTGMLTPECML